MNIFELFLWFILYSVAGWIYESTLVSITQRKFVNRGFLNGPYCPIYGAGAILFILTTSHIDNIFLCFLAGGTLACILEYITSYVLEKLFHARWWDYTPRRFNIHGRICLLGFVVFGAFAVLMPWVHQYVAQYTSHLSQTAITTTAIICAVIFILDIFITNAGLINLNNILNEYQKAIDRHYLHALEFIRQGAHSFEMRIEGTRKHFKNVLDAQQRRTLESFPSFFSTRYNDALDRLRKLNSDDKKKKK